MARRGYPEGRTRTTHGRPAVDGLGIGRSPVAAVDDGAWAVFLGLVASGAKVPDAMLESGIAPAALNGVLQASYEKQVQYEQAKATGRRSEWSEETIESVLDDLANNRYDGKLKTILENHGKPYSKFSVLIRNDPELKESYDMARRMQAELLMDKMREVAEDKEIVPARAKLIVDTYLHTIKALDRERFAPRVGGKTDDKGPLGGVDHAKRMSAAQERLEDMHR